MLSDVDAARISSEWHGGMYSALYSLSCCGAIHTPESDTAYFSRDTLSEVMECLASIAGSDHAEWPIHRAELNALCDYVQHHGARGEQEGWGDLRW